MQRVCVMTSDIYICNGLLIYYNIWVRVHKVMTSILFSCLSGTSECKNIEKNHQRFVILDLSHYQSGNFKYFHCISNCSDDDDSLTQKNISNRNGNTLNWRCLTNWYIFLVMFWKPLSKGFFFQIVSGSKLFICFYYLKIINTVCVFESHRWFQLFMVYIRHC